MTGPTFDGVPAGFYPDGTGLSRFWDGSKWTEHILGPAQGPLAGPPAKRTNHVLHAILTLLTGGFWGIIWIALVLSRRNV